MTRQLAHYFCYYLFTIKAQKKKKKKCVLASRKNFKSPSDFATGYNSAQNAIIHAVQLHIMLSTTLHKQSQLIYTLSLWHPNF